MKKRGILIVFLLSLLFILGCNASIITEKKGILSYSIKGCINKQFNIEKRIVKEEFLEIQTTEDSVNIQHKMNHLCDIDIDIQQSVKGAQITVLEIFTGQGAKCMCDSEISAVIGPLEIGVYNLKIYKKSNDNAPELIKETEISVGQINL